MFRTTTALFDLDSSIHNILCYTAPTHIQSWIENDPRYASENDRVAISTATGIISSVRSACLVGQLLCA